MDVLIELAVRYPDYADVIAGGVIPEEVIDAELLREESEEKENG